MSALGLLLTLGLASAAPGAEDAPEDAPIDAGEFDDASAGPADAAPIAEGPVLEVEDQVEEPLAPAPEAPVDPPTDIPDRPHFVYANTYGLTFGISPLPSVDVTSFFGGALRRREGQERRWAIGYQVTVSVGLAERYILGLLTHRHHIAAYTYSAGGRLFASASLGLAFLTIVPGVLEGEGKLGYLFGARRHTAHIAGVFGGMLRLGWHFHMMEKLPMPQVGLFLGFVVR
ncbi:MAG: hypothetical protein H6710_16305 [Myxococcales bacterium]|nr:hypothetical protein [Myxococcales bacterium]